MKWPGRAVDVEVPKSPPSHASRDPFLERLTTNDRSANQPVWRDSSLHFTSAALNSIHYSHWHICRAKWNLLSITFCSPAHSGLINGASPSHFNSHGTHAWLTSVLFQSLSKLVPLPLVCIMFVFANEKKEGHAFQQLRCRQKHRPTVILD